MFERTHLSELVIRKEEIIQSDKILEFCKNNGITYLKTDQLTHSVVWRGITAPKVDIRNEWLLVTGHSDSSIDHARFKLAGNRLQKWFGQNIDYEDSRLQGIPVGVTNLTNESETHQIIGNVDPILEKLNERKTVRNLLYMNFTVNNQKQERQYVHGLFRDMDWATCEDPKISIQGHRHYIDQVYHHKLVLCPRGNGIDTHRIWETLYLRSIPVVKRCRAMDYFQRLPILFVDNWSQVADKKFLEREYDRILNTKYDLRPLTVSYWCQKIKAAFYSGRQPSDARPT